MTAAHKDYNDDNDDEPIGTTTTTNSSHVTKTSSFSSFSLSLSLGIPILSNFTRVMTWHEVKQTIKLHKSSILSLLQCLLGIYLSFIILSLYQERISRTIYPKTYDYRAVNFERETSSFAQQQQQEAHVESAVFAHLPVDERNEHLSVHSRSEDMFQYAIFIVFLTCLVNTVFAYVRLRTLYPKLMEAHGVPALSFSHSIKFMMASFCFVTGTICSHGALYYVTYPTQVLTKSCKLIPVMISTVIVARKTYRTSRYIVVLFISIGISIFMIDRMKHYELPQTAISTAATVAAASASSMANRNSAVDNHGVGSNQQLQQQQHDTIFLTKEEISAYDHSRFRIGFILLILSLIMDGLTNGIQTIIYNENNSRMMMMKGKKKKGGRDNHSVDYESDSFMFNINLYATVVSAVICIVYKSEMLLAIKFILSHREILWDLSVLCACMAIGQMFIFRTITQYGPLVCSMLTTTRKFVTILFSVMIFRHKLTALQWMGIIIVFSSLIYDIYDTLKTTHDNDVREAVEAETDNQSTHESSSVKIDVRSK